MTDTAGGQSDVGDDLVVVEGITKRFGATLALDDVSVRFRAGRVHALMGENGAGKSTLGRVIAGLHRQDAGTVIVAGVALRPGDLRGAYDAGVRIVHQELAQCPNLSVAENLCLHDLPTSRFGLVDRRAMRARARRLLAGLDDAIDVDAALGSLSPGRRQVVQIAGALDDDADGGGGDGGSATRPPESAARASHARPRSRARMIVFDEPTSSLSVAEADKLMGIIDRLARSGLAIVYVSHRMGEIFACCDRVSVLRDGRHVATADVKDTHEAKLVSQMIGRTIDAPSGERRRTVHPVPGGPAAEGAVLEALDIRSPGKLHGVTVRVGRGEIVGIGGLVGSGRSELLDAIFGLDPRATGEVRVGGRVVGSGGGGGGGGAAESIRIGIGYVPEDRRLQGLFFQMGVGENIVLPSMPRLARFGLRRLRAERELVRDRMARLRVKAASARALPGSLSGGNQQKLLLARWMDAHTKVLLLDEPTRGIDVGTKAEVHRLVREAADEGLAVLVVSSEMPELLSLSDRVIVLCEGRATGELRGSDMTQENVLRLATALHGGRATPVPAVVGT